MEGRVSASIGLPPSPSAAPNFSSFREFDLLFSHLNTLLLSSSNRNEINTLKTTSKLNVSNFLSTSVSVETHFQNAKTHKPNKRIKPVSRNSLKSQFIMNNLSVIERASIGAGSGGIAGAFTYFCLHPLDTIKTKLQTRGASQTYSSAFDAIMKTFRSKGILGFYSGISAAVVGSTVSSAIYFGTCEFGKSLLSKFDKYPPMLIPPTAGAMGNIVSSAIMVPKELITQRMQAGAKGRSWEILLQILERDGVLGLYAGYSATLLRNLPSGVLSYSSFEYLKAALLTKNKKKQLAPVECVCCGALAGAISASLTTPLDVLKTRMMTQVHGEDVGRVAAAMYNGLTANVRQILKEEGWIGFTRGMGPRVLHSACFLALGFFAFETARLTILNQYLKHRESNKMAVAPPLPG